MKRRAVKVIGGIVPSPNLVIGMDSPHMRARSSMASRLLPEIE
jgi:hypothetical protein